jgi:uncharacterized protein YaaW (UPF0174 family)
VSDVSNSGCGGKETVDELRSALELATQEELEQLTQILFQRKFNPLDYWQTPEPLEVQSLDKASWLDAVEERFRFLAADGLKVIQRRTQEISYRQVLIRVCHYLKIPYSQQMTTTEIEAEIFLNLTSRTWKKLPTSEQKSLTRKVQHSLAQSKLAEPLPVQLQHDPINILVKGGSVLAVSSVVRPLILQQIARQFALHFARYQVTQTALVKGGAVAAGQLQKHVALQAAKRGMAMSAARYGAVRTMFAFVGPLLWGCFLADLGWRAIATNYGRIIPTVFALAQIRLLRAECWEMA